MVTNLRKFCGLKELQALFVGIRFPLSRAHTWRFSHPSGCAVYYRPFSRVVTNALNPNPRGMFRAISQF
jgi:hypothetical protein